MFPHVCSLHIKNSMKQYFANMETIVPAAAQIDIYGVHITADTMRRRETNLLLVKGGGIC